MKRLSRHTVVVLLVLLVSSIGGMSVAVVAFGQSGGDPDATVPLGDYTATTPPQGTAPLSSYTTPTTTKAPTSTGESSPTTTHNSRPSRSHGTSPTPTPSAPVTNMPSRVTRSGPTRLAFTGGEPIVIALLGLALMGAGVALQLRRRRRAL